ncbi:MAG: DNA repair protein RadC, partial [Candidatus Omnitrophica bacterium]|nr:DNA repair protein RadC [Candidatus Omnitrophota bacterium]
MTKIKDIPQVDRPREKFLKKGAEALSKSDLLAILLGSGIKGKNVKQLSEHIVKKFGKGFLDIKIKDLLGISGIGQAKALQIVSAISLVKRCYEEQKGNEVIIRNSKDALSLVYDLRDKKKEYLICLYLNARNVLIKKETISIGLLDKSLVHPREIFHPAVEINAASIILVHNHPSGIAAPSEKDIEVVRKISQAGEIMGIAVTDFIIIANNENYSFFERLKVKNDNWDYVAEEVQGTLFDLLKIERPIYEIDAEKVKETYFYIPQIKKNHFQLQNRRYIGNKYKLIDWIFSIVDKECQEKVSFTDIFAGTGVVAAVAARHFEKVILNDLLHSNYAIYQAFFSNGAWDMNKIDDIIRDYNNVDSDDLEDNYFSEYFGGKYFSHKSAKIIGFIRENIEENRNILSTREYYILIAS